MTVFCTKNKDIEIMVWYCRFIYFYFINESLFALARGVSLNKLKEELPSSMQADIWNLELLKIHKDPQIIPVRDPQSLKQEKEFLANPCFLQQINLDIKSLAIFTAQKDLNIAQAIKSCDKDILTMGRQLEATIEIISGSEIHAHALKNSLLSIFTKGYQGFVVVCSQVCINIVLTLAYNLGFGSEIYFWFTLGHPANVDALRYPKNSLAVTFFRENPRGNQTRAAGCTFASNKVNCSSKLLAKSPLFQFSMANSHGHWFPVAKTVLGKINFLKKSVSKSIRTPEFEKKPYLDVTTVFNEYITTLSFTLDHNTLKCRNGILCWTRSNRESHKEPTCCYGYVPEILLLLERDLGIEFIINEVDDGKYGGVVNGTWNGLIGEVLRGRAGMAADIISINRARYEVVDYTDSLGASETILVANTQRHPLPFLNPQMFSAISQNLRLCLGILTVLVGVLLYGIERMKYFHGSYVACRDFVLYAVGLLFQRDMGGRDPRYFGSRTIGISFAVGTMVVMTTYTALLAARNINVAKVLPVTGFDDLKVTQPTYEFKFGTYRDSALSYTFEDHPKPTWRHVGKFMHALNHDSSGEGFEALRNGKVQAIITMDTFLKKEWRASRSCNVQKAGKAFMTVEWAFVLPKDSQWNQPISALFREYKESDKLTKIEKLWLTGKCTDQERDASYGAEQFGIRYLSGACSMLVVGLLLSIVILILECFLRRYFIRRHWVDSYSLNH